VRLEPAAELESIKLGLIEQQSEHFFPIHLINPLQAKIGPGSA
jgi:hypothetical protein